MTARARAGYSTPPALVFCLGFCQNGKMAKKTPRKVAILGTAHSGKICPCWKDPTWEVWGSSRVQPYVTRRDRWFEFHHFDHLRVQQSDEWVDSWLAQIKEDDERMPCPHYMIWPEPSCAADVRTLDTAPLVEKYGSFFLTSSMAWQIAIFLEEVAPNGKAPQGTKLAMYGVELDFGTEYRQQRSGVRHFLQLARHMGVETELWCGGGLVFDPLPYPHWTEQPLVQKLKFRMDNIELEMKALEESREKARARYHETKGRLREVAEQENPDMDRCEYLKKQLDEIEAMGDETQKKLDFCRGAKHEMEYMKDYQTP